VTLTVDVKSPCGSCHPYPLMLPAFLTHTPCDVRRTSPVLKIVSTGSHQSAIEGCRPLVIGLGQAPKLASTGVRTQACVSLLVFSDTAEDEVRSTT
jgi:hypothetical protein